MLASWSDQIDHKLLQAIQQGNHHAFATLVRRHNKRFYSLAYRFTNDRYEAEDIVQTAFLKLWEKPDKWNAAKQCQFTTWFYRIITNLCLDREKKKKPLFLTEEIEIVAETESPDAFILHSEQQQQMELEISALPERQRIALNLCFYEELSNKEAAAIMNINLKALQSLLMRAKTNLKNKMKAYL